MTTSFRDLPDAPEAFEEEQSRAVEDIERDITDLEVELAPFRGAAWMQLEQIVANELATQVNGLIGLAASIDQSEVLTRRGRAQALRWLLNMPKALEDRMNYLMNELANATQPEGELADG